VKTMTNEFGVGAIALPYQAPTSHTSQGIGVSAFGTGFRPATGGAALRLRARDLSVATDSPPGGPVI